MLIDSVIYLKDTPPTRKILTKEFGSVKSIDMSLMKDYTYIEFDIFTNKWRPTLSFEWLYRDNPKLSKVDDLIYHKNLQNKYKKWYRRIFLDKINIYEYIFKDIYGDKVLVFYHVHIKKWNSPFTKFKRFDSKKVIKSWLGVEYWDKRVIIKNNIQKKSLYGDVMF